MQNQPPVFISYRRDDLDTAALRIKQCLEEVFGEGTVFLDVDINYGAPWPERIKTAIHGAEVVLALIGPRWFEVRNEHGARRIDRKNDWVRRELEEALEKGIEIIPVVFDRLKKFEAAEAYPEDSTLIRIKDLKKFDILKDYFEDHLNILITKHLLPRLGQVEGLEAKLASAQEFDPLKDLPLPLKITGKMPEEEAPYIGLRPFERKDALLFHGRGQMILELHHKIQDHRVTLLYGYSGVGKSSLLFAGLFPRIEDQWTIRYIRRDYQTGLDHQLAEALRQIRGSNQGPYLLMLDQAEEMFTAPNLDLPKETENFGKELSNAVDAYPDVNFIIGYRSDYYVQLDELLKPHRLPKGEYLLRPLDRQGILAAINGVPNSPLNDTYKVVIQDGIDKVMAEELSRDVSSAVGPLLQVQLRLLWDAATALSGKLLTRLTHFTAKLLEGHFNKNLETFLESQLARLRNSPWEEALEMGLVLDLLHFYTTERYTAASRADAELKDRYESEQMDGLLIQLKQLYLLAGDPASAKPATRLAHDALAPVVRDRFNDSNRPAQQAWRILEAKRYDPKANFSDSDIRTLHEGRPFMPVIEAQLAARIAADEAELLRKARQLEENQDFIFQRLAFDAREAIRTVDHLDALEKFETALRFEYPLQAQVEELLDGLLELLFFFNEAADEARVSAVLKQIAVLLREVPAVAAELRASEQDLNAGRITEFLQKHYPERHRSFRERYYPVMIDVAGGQYERGGGDYTAENPAHPVKVGSFRLAKTLCTFYQYSLYCYSTGIKIAGHSPPWGRRGDHPLVLVRWYEAITFLNWLSEHLGLDPAYTIDRENSDPNNLNDQDFQKWTVKRVAGANGFRLPTEAEWEWGARGGTEGGGLPYAGSEDAGETVWGKETSPDGTQPAATLSPNELGLFDMCGNAWEWCWDWYGETHYADCKKKGVQDAPAGPEQGSFRVVRGGSYYNLQGNL